MSDGGWRPEVRHLYFYSVLFMQLFAFSLGSKRVNQLLLQLSCKLDELIFFNSTFEDHTILAALLVYMKERVLKRVVSRHLLLLTSIKLQKVLKIGLYS